MAFEDLQAEIGLLLTELDGEQGDRHEIYLRIRQMLDTMKAEGLPLPQDLVELEKALEAEFSSETGDGPNGG
ncbi:hypothetical protein EOI86_14070 [Hwanghaeella grinnelliae]|uniref:Uncharacterized protein n=1 Tax=Hwanghaeella grinnelliae TaxID=2500179 RepID=A0A437QP63_9PROT|nr:hypothetical protein [Hwanghaeella grinnelliae]RVU36333.1 hypothetical protein EOI86_14070 [Hwanghaeella grinnelliae]